jgi:hypothetical protein
LSARFEASETGVTLRFFRGDVIVAPDTWALTASRAGCSAIDALRRFEAQGRAVLDDSGALLDHDAVAALSTAEAVALGLPPPAEVVLALTMRGSLTDAAIEARWTRPDGRPLLSAERDGAFLRIGGQAFRLPDPLFGIARALDDYKAAPAADPDERMRRLVILKAVLPDAPDPSVTASGMLLTMKIAYAEAFSLDATGSSLDPRIIPTLHHSLPAGEDEPGRPDPLLPEIYQQAFAERRFAAFPTARPAYALGDGWYVALARPLQAALQVVRDMQDAAPSARREFFRNPRPWLQDRLGANYEATVVERLFRETEAYSARVIGLGLWQPRVVPWIKRPPADWFGPAEYGLDVGGRRVTVPDGEAAALASRIDDAIARGQSSVRVTEPEGEEIPATEELRDALRRLAAESDSIAAPAASQQTPGSTPPRHRDVLLIAPNEAAEDYVRPFTSRHPPLPETPPRHLRTELKPHQAEGLRWVRNAWNAGRPGVLLADDMGLGKTLQCLAFLSLLREAMTAGRLAQRPLLVVAPVGLLANWRSEHDLHLQHGGLGRVCQAFGPGLAMLRTTPSDLARSHSLDRAALAGADWVLTTYETLRDNQVDFGLVPFGAAVFDEAQRIKTPAARVTDAAKGINADFTMAITGTPVENRLADLWCIVDTVQPGLLGELKAFSARYEQNPDTAILMRLKGELERTSPATPQLMLRRMKADRLPGLPEKTERTLHRDMPPMQADAYHAALMTARDDASRGGKLRALQKLRAISLHPAPNLDAEDSQFVAASARLTACCEILDLIRDAGDKALVFLEDLALQVRLAGLLQRRYRLPRAPMIVSGEVAGLKRQDRVQAFQVAPQGFDVMILSPRAAGVGLTLTAANHVIHLTRWWNPAVEDQCTDRVHRIGQTRPVSVHIPMAVLPNAAPRSFDRSLHALLERKRNLAAGLLAAPAPTVDDEDVLFRETVGSDAAPVGAHAGAQAAQVGGADYQPGR